MENFKSLILLKRIVPMATKKYVLLFIATLCMCCVFAQQADYMVHAIKKGETLSSLAKQYNTTVGDIMRLNGMNSKSILQLGQQVKIPMKAPVEKATAAAPVTAPVSPVDNTIPHKVVAKETLYGIAKKYHVTEKQLMKWNNMPNDKIKIGQVLIVGVRKEAEKQSTLTPEVTYSPGKPDVIKDTAKTKKPTVPDAVPPQVTYTPGKPDNDGKKKANVNEAAAETVDAPKEGFFKSEFKKTGQDASGTAATFKTASGWADKKYYVLMNKIDAGTVVRITANNKTIYAKVLGALPDIKEDNGLLLRMSNSAASALGVADKFDIVVSY